MLRGMLAAYGHKDDQSLPLAQPYNQLPIMGAQYGQQAEPLAQSFQPQYPIIPQPYIPPMGDQYDQQGHPTPPQTPSSPVAAFDATPLRASADNNGQSSSTGNVQLEREARSLSMPLESFQALAVYGNDTNGPINNGDSVFAPNPEQPLVEFVVQDSSTQPQPNVFDRFFHWSDQDTIIDPAITQEQPQLPTPPPALPTSSDLDDLFEDPSWDAMDFGD